MKRFTLGLGLAMATSSVPALAQISYSAAGPTAADITGTVDTFRSGLGTLNPSVVGSFDSGRREINWDGVPDAFADPNALPANFFNSNSPRGVVFSTPGTGFEVSANAGGIAPIEFGYPLLFAPFSAQRLFTAVNSNVLDVSFFIPGTATPALTTGFGAVFSDVDLPGSASISFFGTGDVPLGTWNVPSITGNETFSFLGVLFPDAIVSRVRITSGTAALGSTPVEGGSVDLVAMDDFIFGEPRLPASVPEPGTWAMLLLGFGAVGLMRRRDRRTSPNGIAAN